MRLQYPKLVVLALFCVVIASGCSAKAKAQKYMQRGDAYYEQKDWTKAKLEYLNAFSKGSRNPKVISRLGECFLQDGDPQTAARFLLQARNLQPTNTAVRAKLGSLFLLARNNKEAKAEAEAILKIIPDHREALLILADAVTNKQEVVELRTRFTALATAHPTNAALPFALGQLALKLRDLPTAKDYFETSLRMDANQPKVHMALAQIARAQNDTNAADAQFRAASELAPTKSLERLKQAEHLISTQRREEAEKLLIDTVNKEPDFLQALNMLTESFLVGKKIDAAETYNKKALAVAANNLDALLNRARIKMLKKDLNAAITDLQGTTKTYPRSAPAQFQLALVYLANKDTTRALAALDTAIALDPNQLQAALLRSEIQVRNRNFEPAIAELTRLSSERPGVAEVRFLLGNAYYGKRDYANALIVYTGLVKDLPEDARPAYLAGLVYREQNKLTEARKSFETSLKASETFLPSLEQLLAVELLEKKAPAALARIESYLAKYSEKPALLMLKANVQIQAGNPNGAIATLQTVLEKEPDSYQAQTLMVQTLIQSGKADEAITKLEAMAKKNDKDAGVLVQLGMLYETKKDFKAARANYEAALKLAPNQPIPLNNLANLIIDQFGDLAAGVEYARRAHEAAPENPAIADTYGWTLYRKGDYARAVNILEESAEGLKAMPGSLAEGLYHLGMAYYMTGNEASALKSLEAAVSSDSMFFGKDRARAALAVLKINSATADPASLELLNKAIAEQPNDVMAQLRLGQLKNKRGDWAGAAQAFEGALKISPNSQSILVALADLKFNHLGDKGRALELAKAAWAIGPDPGLASTLGRIGYLGGDLKWATEVLTQGHKARPDDGLLSFWYAQASYAGGDLREAASALQESVRQKNSPETAKPTALLINFELGRTAAEEAVVAAKKVLSLDRTSAPALISSGLLAEQKKDFGQARTNYEEVLKLYPGHIRSKRQLGLLLVQQGSGDQRAFELLNAIKTTLPGDVEVTKALGLIAYRQGDYKEAARLLRDASIKLPSDPELQYHLGFSLHRLNERTAKETLNRALELDAKSPMAADARKALAALK